MGQSKGWRNTYRIEKKSRKAIVKANLGFAKEKIFQESTIREEKQCTLMGQGERPDSWF